MTKTPLLSDTDIRVLRAALEHRLIVVCFGAGVDSTAMLVALNLAGLRPHLISMADTGGEKPETMAHIHVMNEVLRGWGWPAITIPCAARCLSLRRGIQPWKEIA